MDDLLRGCAERILMIALKHKSPLSVEDKVRAVADELAALMLWQPIETAPKDGTCILGFDSRPVIVGWEVYDRGLERWEDSGGFERNVTHWMPLPDPPDQKSGE